MMALRINAITGHLVAGDTGRPGPGEGRPGPGEGECAGHPPQDVKLRRCST
jgi:hypothetical protein